METICSLKPNVTREEAVLQFARRGVAAPVCWLFHGPLRSVAMVYIPFRLFRVEINNCGTRQLRWLALDAVTGAFDPYSFDGEIAPESLLHLFTRNHPPARLSCEQGQQLLAERVRRLVFGSGFFRIRDLEIRTQVVPIEFHVPYWVGFFGPGPVARIAVIDAVRRRFEGSKVRNFCYEWLGR